MKLHSKILFSFFLVFCTVIFTGWGLNPFIVEMELSPHITMEKGEAKKLNLNYTPNTTHVSKEAIDSAINKLSVKWTSSNKIVATVDENGLVTAHKAGKANIIATAEGNTLTASCKVEVKAPLTDLTVPNRMVLTINHSDRQNLNTVLHPADATDIIVTYHSSDESIAVVDEDGTVTGLADGKCMITTKAINVNNPEQECIKLYRTFVTVQTAPKTISLPNSSIYVNNSACLSVNIEPKETSIGRQFTLTSSNENILAFTGDGSIKGIAPGTVTVTATNEIGQSTQCTVSVMDVPIGNRTSYTFRGMAIPSSPIITNTADFYKAYSQFNNSDTSHLLGIFRYPKANIALDIIWDGSLDEYDQPDIGIADSLGGIPGDMNRYTIIGDHDYQSGNILASNLETGDQVTLETSYGTFVYAYTGQTIASQSQLANINYPSKINHRYGIEDCTMYDYISTDGESLIGHSWTHGNQSADGKLIFRTNYGTSQVLLLEFEMVSGIQLLY